MLRVPAVLGLYATSSLFVIIIIVIKGKGTESGCGIRPITLLSIPGKLFANVLLERIQPLIDMSGRPEQSGFVAGRSTVDAILALRLLSDLHREFDRPLNVAILESRPPLTQSRGERFGRHCAVLAQSCAVPDFLLDLIAALHENTGVQVRFGQNFSDRLQTA